MKCDDCYFRDGYTLGQDECGAGNLFEYCAKGHWEGSGPRDEEEYKEMASDMIFGKIAMIIKKKKIKVYKRLE